MKKILFLFESRLVGSYRNFDKGIEGKRYDIRYFPSGKLSIEYAHASTNHSSEHGPLTPGNIFHAILDKVNAHRTARRRRNSRSQGHFARNE